MKPGPFGAAHIGPDWSSPPSGKGASRTGCSPHRILERRSPGGRRGSGTSCVVGVVGGRRDESEMLVGHDDDSHRRSSNSRSAFIECSESIRSTSPAWSEPVREVGAGSARPANGAGEAPPSCANP